MCERLALSCDPMLEVGDRAAGYPIGAVNYGFEVGLNRGGRSHRQHRATGDPGTLSALWRRMRPSFGSVHRRRCRGGT